MTLFFRRKSPFKIYEINMISANDTQLLQISQKFSIGLNLTDLKTVKKYFASKGRNPTDLELQIIGQTWSEHCFHRTFKGDITFNGNKIQSLMKTYISKVTNELNPTWCISVFEDNAGIVEFNEEYAIAAKVETHNHPSAIEPFGGAATGVGGVIRDVLGVWADPIACMDVLGFGPLNFDYDKLPHGVKHPKYLFKGVVAGIGCYGNNMGIPTINGAICFDESYVGNVVVYCGCIGLLPKDQFVKHARPGDIILLVGGRTGRDGIHGVTFASAELNEKSEEVSRPAVQIANPIEEEKLKRAINQVRDKRLSSGITDLGGGGLSSAIGEMAHRFNCGALVYLDKVPLKYEDLIPWEIYISESQERMLLLVPRKNLKEVIDIFYSEEVEATQIGQLTEDSTLKVLYRQNKIADLTVDFLFSPPKIERYAEWSEVKQKEPIFSKPDNLNRLLLKLLASSNIASRERIVRTYDHEVKGNTVLKPLHGKFGGPIDAAVIKPLTSSFKGITVSSGINPQYGKIDPYWMAASVIDEAIRNNIAVGGRRIALLDNFVWGSPEKPDRLGGLVRACEACFRFAKEFQTPFISGKDSLYNESPLGPVTPTLLITAIGVIPDIRKSVSLDLKTPGNTIFLVGQTFSELGGSEYSKLLGYVGKSVPQVRVPQARNIMTAMTKAIDNYCIEACHDLSEGGLAVAAAEMGFTSEYGLDLRLKNVPVPNRISRDDILLFSESNSRFLVEVPEEQLDRFEYITRAIPHAAIGEVTDNRCLSINGFDNENLVKLYLNELLDAWKNGLEVEM